VQEKSGLKFLFNTQVQENPGDNDSWLADKALVGLVF